MKIFKSMAFLATMSPSLLAADTTSEARSAFKAWEPKSLELETDGTLRVVLPQKQITDTIYYATIQAGFCLGVAFGKQMSDVTSVFILNQYEAQGWLFEGGAASCKDINAAPSKRAQILIAAQSSIHTDTENGL